MVFTSGENLMLYCYFCERQRDCHEFPDYPVFRKGKICISCLSNYPNHPKMLKLTNLGYYLHNRDEKDHSINYRRQLLLEDDNKVSGLK